MRARSVVLLAAAALLGAAGAAAFVVRAGLYDVAATKPHLQPVFSLLETAVKHSVRRRARDIAVPRRAADAPGADGALAARRGAACYRVHCLQCHGGPGVAPEPMSLGMQPLPPPLVAAAAQWKPAELYWITRHGLKMTGMPAWQHRLGEADLWAVVFFVEQLATFTPDDFAATLAAAGHERCDVPEGTVAASPLLAASAAGGAAAGPDAERGRLAMAQYGCNGCHTIPGVTSAQPQVGPPLAGFARRTQLPGGLANTAQNLERWLRDPRGVDAHTAMPALGLSAADARDIVAYLTRLR
ncbi:MAG: c-type cytochrome [Rubrivivax sp.]|nr:c-type cytochrome [Rubrivivax sp.]